MAPQCTTSICLKAPTFQTPNPVLGGTSWTWEQGAWRKGASSAVQHKGSIWKDAIKVACMWVCMGGVHSLGCAVHT
eukprot:1162039-Pelagomonas_calceolata.AAC.6